MTDRPCLIYIISDIEAVTSIREMVCTYSAFRIHIIHCANLLCGSNNSCSLDGYAIAETFALTINNTWYEYVTSNSVRLSSLDDGVVRLHGLGTSQSFQLSVLTSAAASTGQVKIHYSPSSSSHAAPSPSSAFQTTPPHQIGRAHV